MERQARRARAVTPAGATAPLLCVTAYAPDGARGGW
jgi:hypothetical protein